MTALYDLASDTSDPFGAWQSARVDNQTSEKAIDYEVGIHILTKTGTIGGDSAAYVYVIPWVYDGSAWLAHGNFGTITLPTGTDAAASISDPNSMKGPYVIPIKINLQILDGWFTIGQMCGGIVPDGWSIAIRNSTGLTFEDNTPTTNISIAYRKITFTNA